MQKADLNCNHIWQDYSPHVTRWGKSEAWATLECIKCGLRLLASRECGSLSIEKYRPGCWCVGINNAEAETQLQEALEQALHSERRWEVAPEHAGSGYALSSWMGRRIAAKDVNASALVIKAKKGTP